MSLFLQPDVRIRVEGDALLLSRGEAPPWHALGAGEAIALALLGATGDAPRAEALCAECLPGGDGGRWLRRVLDRYWTYLGDGPPRPLDPEWVRAVGRSRPRLPLLPASNLRREAAPASVTWMVTLACNRRCPYCFFEVTPHAAEAPESPRDATFPREAAVRMVREMARIGAADLYLTGGEPLLRRDLPEIIEEASAARVRAHVVTKYPVDPPFAARLARAGLSSATLSLDDVRPRQAAALAGAPGYLGEATRAITALLEAGIPLEVNAVVTAVNRDHFEPLVRYAIDLGVPRLKLSPFSAPYPGRAAADRLLTGVDVPALVERLRQAHGDRIALEAGGATIAEGPGARACSDQAVCEIGTRALDVLPDGRVTRCHYLPGRPEMAVGSLLESDLLEIWTGRPLAALTRPDRSAYEGTACSGCGELDGCSSRGRCYVSSLMKSDRLHAPDAFCVAEPA